MNSEKFTLTHPFDSFNYRRSSAKENMCFVIMPFAPQFDLVYDVIRDAVKDIMECHRADDIDISNSILECILEGISSAGLIIADLTGQNPNVFYELGLAHTCTKNVILLTQNINDVPFDLRGLRCRTYSLNSKKDLNQLAEMIRREAIGFREKHLVVLIEGRKERTEKIVMYMRQLLREDPNKLKDMIILHEAGLSSLSNIPHLEEQEHLLIEYGELLVEERRLLIELLRKGAKINVIISPLAPYITKKDAIVRNRQRLVKLLEFLEESTEEVKNCMKNCTFVVSENPGFNLLFFGEDILFEGHKPTPGKGFGWTLAYSDKDYIKDRIRIFEDYFKVLRVNTTEQFGSTGEKNPNDPEHLRKAVIVTIRKAIERIDAKLKRVTKDDNETTNEHEESEKGSEDK